MSVVTTTHDGKTFHVVGTVCFPENEIATAPASALPAKIDPGAAHHSAVVVLVDAKMLLATGWDGYVADLWQECLDVSGPHRLLPVSLTEAAYELHPQVQAANRAYDLNNYGSEFFPRMSNVQQQVFKESLSGSQFKQHVPFLLITPTAPEKKGVERRKDDLP